MADDQPGGSGAAAAAPPSAAVEAPAPAAAAAANAAEQDPLVSAAAAFKEGDDAYEVRYILFFPFSSSRWRLVMMLSRYEQREARSKELKREECASI